MKMIAKWNRPDSLFPVTLRGVDDLVHALFGHLSTEFTPEGMCDCGCTPQLELETADDAVIARLPLAGCKPESIDVEVVGDSLTVRASREETATGDENARFLRRERTTEEYEQSVRLPVPVRGGETVAKYEDGVLTITLPREKKEKSRSHVIKVN